MEHSQGSWTDTKLAYPNPGDCGGRGSPKDLPEPSCASPTDCANHRSTHVTSCIPAVGTSSSSAGGGSSSETASGAGVGGSGGGGGVDDSGALHGSCGCRVGGEDRRGDGAVLILAALGVIAIRRRRHF